MTNNKLRFRNAFAISSLALSIGLGCWLVLPSSADDEKAGANLIRNGTMDEASKEDSNQIAQWTKNGDIEGVKHLWAHDEWNLRGKKNLYLAIKKTANRYMPIAAWEQTIDAPLSAPAITVKAKVRAGNVTKAIIDAVFLNDKDEWMQHKWVAYIGSTQTDGPPLSHDWKLYEGTVAIPSDAKKVRISLQDYGPGTVYFDDVSANFENDTSKITDAVQVATANEAKLPAAADPAALVPGVMPAAPANAFTANPATAYTPATPGLPGNVIAATPTSPPAVVARGQYVPGYAQSTQGYVQSQLSAVPQMAYSPYRQTQPYPQQGNPGWQPFADPVQAVEAVYQQQVPVTKTDYVDGRPVTSTSYVIKHITSDGQQFTSADIATTHAKTLRLAADVQKETDADAKAKLRDKLAAAVTEEYGLLRAERQSEVDELAKKLEDVRANLAKRDEQKSEIIDARVEHLATKPQALWSFNRPVPPQQYQTQTILTPVPASPYSTQFNPVSPFQPIPNYSVPGASTLQQGSAIQSAPALNPAGGTQPAIYPPAAQPTLNTSEPFVTEGPANPPVESAAGASPASAKPPEPQTTQPGR